MKKALSLFLALLMLTGCCCVFAAAEEPDLTGYVKLKDPDVDTLEDGDWYFDYLQHTIYWVDDQSIYGNMLPFSHLSAEEQAEQIATDKEWEFWYQPETKLLYACVPAFAEFGIGGEILDPEDENSGYDLYAPFVRQYSAPDALDTPDTPSNPDTPTPADTPTTPDNGGSNNNSNNAPKQNFFQRIIEWFRNLFAKLFK